MSHVRQLDKLCPYEACPTLQSCHQACSLLPSSSRCLAGEGFTPCVPYHIWQDQAHSRLGIPPFAFTRLSTSSLKISEPVHRLVRQAKQVNPQFCPGCPFTTSAIPGSPGTCRLDIPKAPQLLSSLHAEAIALGVTPIGSLQQACAPIEDVELRRDYAADVLLSLQACPVLNPA